MSKPLKACEPCAFWTYCGCLLRLKNYRTTGPVQSKETCYGFQRDPGVEG
jgi:hypothetical protein